MHSARRRRFEVRSSKLEVQVEEIDILMETVGKGGRWKVEGKTSKGRVEV